MQWTVSPSCPASVTPQQPAVTAAVSLASLGGADRPGGRAVAALPSGISRLSALPNEARDTQ